MNKDVYYIEPEDDITDIITRLKTANKKIIALVPPKKVNVLRSVINLKLIAKTARNLDKAVVIITVDPALMKMSASVGLPFSKNLQSRPVLPSEFKDEKLKTSTQKRQETDSIDSEVITSSDDFDDRSDEAGMDSTEQSETSPLTRLQKIDSKKQGKTAKNTKSIAPDPRTTSKRNTDPETLVLDSTEDDSDSKEKSSHEKLKKIPSLDHMRKWLILGIFGVVVVAAFGVWAFFFAPAAKISVKIKTTPDNFSENITFVSSADLATNKDGKILLETENFEKEASVEFDATGERNDGERATGKLTVTANFNFSTSSASSSSPEKITIPTGSAFAKGSLNYLTTDTTEFSWDGSTTSCTNRVNNTCQIRKTVTVVAFEGGTKYNIDASATNWQSSVEHVDAFNSGAFSGGTDKITKVVTHEDVEKAKLPLSQVEDGKEELFGRIKDSDLKIDASYKKSIGNIVSSPAIGEPTNNGKAKLSTKMTYKINTLDKKAIEEYIKTIVSSRLGEDQKIYDVSSLFIERFQEGSPSSAKIKATVKTGPEVTEQNVLEKSLGKKVGEVTTLIKSINGVSEVKINTSFPWVRNIPNDANKVNVNITIEDNN